LRITGNADAVDWRTCLRRYPRAVLALEHLSLDYRQEPAVEYEGWLPSRVSPVVLSEHAVQALSAATRLTALKLRAEWDGRASMLLRALPALADVG
jgi:hypothetical protein